MRRPILASCKDEESAFLDKCGTFISRDEDPEIPEAECDSLFAATGFWVHPYSELTPEGMWHLLCDVDMDNKVVADLGSGLGNLAVNITLTFPKVSRIIGVEMSPTRARAAQQKLLNTQNRRQLRGKLSFVQGNFIDPCSWEHMNTSAFIVTPSPQISSRFSLHDADLLFVSNPCCSLAQQERLAVALVQKCKVGAMIFAIEPLPIIGRFGGVANAIVDASDLNKQQALVLRNVQHVKHAFPDHNIADMDDDDMMPMYMYEVEPIHASTLGNDRVEELTCQSTIAALESGPWIDHVGVKDNLGDCDTSYGELTVDGMRSLFDDLDLLGKHVVDLGSGFGTLVRNLEQVTQILDHLARAYPDLGGVCGVELTLHRHEAAVRRQQELAQDAQNINAMQKVEFYHGDLFEKDLMLKHADIVYVSNLVLARRINEKIATKICENCKSGTVVFASLPLGDTKGPAAHPRLRLVGLKHVAQSWNDESVVLRYLVV